MRHNVSSPPMFSSLYLVCESHRHATALAIVLFFANLIGLGLGPFLAGVISDYLAPSYGPAESLRWAIMILFLSMFAAGGFMLRAARPIKNDRKRVVSGTCVSVRFDLGGPRLITKTTTLVKLLLHEHEKQQIRKYQ